jgi:hypothetical protein
MELEETRLKKGLSRMVSNDQAQELQQDAFTLKFLNE